MKFTLHYRGPLPSLQGDDPKKKIKKAEAKHQIRQYFAPQLQDLWQQPPLSNMSKDWLDPEYEYTAIKPKHGWTFASVVNENNHGLARLEILFLRPCEPGGLVGTGGDVDNRIKTLLDALSIPQQENQIPTNEQPPPAPVHCLLQDDKLITGLNIDVGRLLNYECEDEVLLTVAVTVHRAKTVLENLFFASL